MPAIDTTLLESFHQFVGKQLESPSTAPQTPEEALARWREEQDSLSAIKEGLAEVDIGNGITLDEFAQQIRKKFGFETLQ